VAYNRRLLKVYEIINILGEGMCKAFIGLFVRRRKIKALNIKKLEYLPVFKRMGKSVDI
jgi:hypothetical protein